MPGGVENNRKHRRRAGKAARWFTAACESLENRRLLSGYGQLVSVGSFVPFPNGENPQSAVTFDVSGNLWGTTTNGGPNGYGTVFEITNGSSAITTVASFNGINGANPYAAVTFDTSGNLWGTTAFGGANYSSTAAGGGEVFEITKGTSTITTVASFNVINGINPKSGVTFDASGNVWGTTSSGGLNFAGTVFEIGKGSSTITTVASFNRSAYSLPKPAVTFDASGNLWGTTYVGGPSDAGTVFKIAKGSTTITTVASFDRSNGAFPQGAVTFDANGNLWGTTSGGGVGSPGTVFEIAKGVSTISTIASFNQTNGQNPYAAVTFDASGNLWGTTYGGGVSGNGTAFEIAKGSSTITTVASFNGTNGANPYAAVTFDTSGNLWGTTNGGGVGNHGTVFEIAKGSSTITTVVSFIETNGRNPAASLSFDASGNLWGTSYSGGTSNDGTVFEIAKASSTITTVASFNGANGANPQAAVAFDASGNLWGTAYNGGSGGYGTVFEIAKGSSTITTVASFNGSNGENPEAAVTFDAGGNLWGTAYNGGSGGYGTVFEIAKGSSTITTVASFNGSNGENPEAAVTFDAGGNLWGTAFYGGPSGYGTVYEILEGSSTITTVASFIKSNGAYPYSAVTFDASGNLWGTTGGGGTSDFGTVFEIAKGSSTVTTVGTFNVNNGANPNAPVTFDPSGDLWGTTAGGGLYQDGTVFKIANGSSTISTVTNFNGNGIGPKNALTFDANGNLWGTNYGGGTASAGSVWEVLPWLSDPAGNDTWNTASHTLIVNEPSTIIADPGADQPIIQANGSSAVVTINPSSALAIHLGGLSLTNGASAIVTSLGAARTANNHRVLVLGQPGAASAPVFTIDPSSKLDLSDNDLVDHTGSLSSVTGLVTSGFSSGWAGNGIVSSKAGGSAINAVGVGQPAAAGNFDSETVGTSDVEIRYTYYGDANLDGQVDASDYSKTDFGFLNQLAGWSNGDFNYDGVIDGSDYTLIDNAFNTQGASLSASIAPPNASARAQITLRSVTLASAPVSNRGAIGRPRIASFAPSIFSTERPIALTESMQQSIEFSFQKRDLLDQLSFSQ